MRSSVRSTSWSGGATGTAAGDADRTGRGKQAAAAGFGLLGIFHKVADHPNCRPRMVTMLLLLMLMLLRSCAIIQIVQQIGSDVDGSIVITIPPP